MQIPEGEALALRSTRIMGRLRVPSILSMLWEMGEVREDNSLVDLLLSPVGIVKRIITASTV